MSLSPDSSPPVEKPLKWFEVRGRFQASDIDDALWWLAEYDPTDEDGHPANDRLHWIEVEPA